MSYPADTAINTPEKEHGLRTAVNGDGLKVAANGASQSTCSRDAIAQQQIGQVAAHGRNASGRSGRKAIMARNRSQ